MSKKAKFNNRGGAWFNREPKSDKSPTCMGSATIKGKDYWMSTWLQAPEDCPKVEKALLKLQKAMEEEITDKGGRPVVSVTFKKK